MIWEWISANGHLLLDLFILYGLLVAFWLISENRSPQSTFAWIFLLLLFPLGGIVFYHFFRHGWRTFSKEGELTRQAIMGDTPEAGCPLYQASRALVAQLEQVQPAAYKRKLLHLVTNNASSVLTAHDCVELLQNASQKYPPPVGRY